MLVLTPKSKLLSTESEGDKLTSKTQGLKLSSISTSNPNSSKHASLCGDHSCIALPQIPSIDKIDRATMPKKISKNFEKILKFKFENTFDAGPEGDVVDLRIFQKPPKSGESPFASHRLVQLVLARLAVEKGKFFALFVNRIIRQMNKRIFEPVVPIRL